MRRRGESYKIAVGGVLCALALGLMFLGVIPFATFVAPALASLCVLFFVIEYSKKMAFAIYGVISVLSLLLVPEKEVVFVFIFIFGYYPILKAALEKRFSLFPAMLIKLACFNLAAVGMYLLLVNVFVIGAVKDEFAAYSTLMIAGLLLLGNVVFVVFDLGLTRLLSVYIRVIRPKLFRT